MVAVLLPRLTLAVQETLEGEGSVPVVPGEVAAPLRGSTGLLAGLKVNMTFWVFSRHLRQAGLQSALC